MITKTSIRDKQINHIPFYLHNTYIILWFCEEMEKNGKN